MIEPQTYQPMNEELMDGMALLILENDSLKEELGRPVGQFGRREWTHLERMRGREVGPTAIIQDGKLIVRCDS